MFKIVRVAGGRTNNTGKSSDCLTPAEPGSQARPPSKAAPSSGELLGICEGRPIALGTPTGIAPSAGSASESHNTRQRCRY